MASVTTTEDFCITISEAMMLFGKSKRAVDWAIWKDWVKARQALKGDIWLISYASCVKFWGQPVMPHFVEQMRMDYHG
jgi:hypothetical protein